MPLANTVMYEEQHQRINEVLARLGSEANARATFLIDRNGQQIASNGRDVETFDATSLASLTAGNVASTDAIANLIGEKEFAALVHEGEKDSLHISLINTRIIMLILFDENSSLGLVKLRARKATEDLVEIFEQVDEIQKTREAGGEMDESPFGDITDDDIDSLFA